jgi:hypothetical protein
VEIRLNKIKKDADQLEEQQKQDRSWFENYKKVVGIKPLTSGGNNTAMSPSIKERS